MDLRSPLEYEEIPGLDPFSCNQLINDGAPELLFCYELDKDQSQRIDPQEDCFLGQLVFSGRGGPGNFQLSAGLYLFAQQRSALSRDECIALAIEQQKDGLWERLRLGDRLYIRRLFEDGSPVTQIFRPYAEKTVV
ncbi:MAG: hypothetical protein LBI06_07355 [Treponema sp.]|nr:hypothetical protein [Treponema sp.]